MRTITVDIINEKAFNLLKNLEVLQLIRVRESEVTPAPKADLSKFKGALKKQPLEEVELQLKELRDAWETKKSATNSCTIRSGPYQSSLCG